MHIGENGDPYIDMSTLTQAKSAAQTSKGCRPGARNKDARKGEKTCLVTASLSVLFV
jgi:hypothetical protein